MVIPLLLSYRSISSYLSDQSRRSFTSPLCITNPFSLPLSDTPYPRSSTLLYSYFVVCLLRLYQTQSPGRAPSFSPSGLMIDVVRLVSARWGVCM